MIEEGKANANEMIRAVVGFGHDRLTEKLTPLMNGDKMPLIATRDMKTEFSDKAQYPYYNRISWHEGSVTHSLMLAVKSRNWKHVALLRSAAFTLNYILYEEAKLMGIVILGEIVLPEKPESEWTRGDLADYMLKLKKLGTRIVFSYISSPLIYHALREAYLMGLSCMHGYQWIMVGLSVWTFPWYNQHPECQEAPICTVAYTGLLGFSQSYSVLGYDTPDWIRVMGHHMYSDRSIYKGRVKYDTPVTGAEMALGYDAVRVVATAMTTVINSRQTVTGEEIALQIRQVRIFGLTGNILFDSAGDRPGYLGGIVCVNPHPPALGTPPTNVAMFIRIVLMTDMSATDQMEVIVQAVWPLYLPPYNFLLGQIAFPNTTYVNKRYYNSTSGFYGRDTEQIEPIPPSTDPPVPMVREEISVAPFYCSQGCGGPQLTETDITKYLYGTCTSMEVCTCNAGYYESDCSKMICSCKNGHCDLPGVCICDAGWYGAECDHAVCIPSCSANGRCTAPNTCECSAGYIGGTCNTTLGVVVAVPLIFGSALIVGIVFLIRKISKRQARLAALKNLDWLAKWEDLTGLQRAVSLIMSAASSMNERSGHTIFWKHQKCYCQEYNVETLDINDDSIRLEMVLLKEARHNNIITFVGACLEAPHVCLLTEYAPKGSLEDILSNDTVKLGWDFRFSILKDICRGMDYLHRSEIGSHGRLKSSNCLIDDRWTCKLSGFGCPTMRYKSPKTDADEQVHKLSALFWTAPELVSGCTTVDQVGSGTKPGDVYSFTIVVTEICTREEPFTQELQFMEQEHIINMVIDKDNPKNEVARTLWKHLKTVDTTGPFRPNVDDSFLPEDYDVQKNMRKLMADGWNSSPELRPTFREMLFKLNEINPVKGELIDNLVSMLEKYSSNLEAIVVERTKKLMVEKARTEQLISQMLPKKVVEDLKHGRPVEPESFECVTIFISDIVGFTSIARNSTPLQVVDLLNDLYTTFDAILDKYDVYKVETIGDAYMVVSGLPIRNGDLHAGEIATMSLDLLSSMRGFTIRHMPDETLQLRVGMHSGPAVAGVVGLKMPRYCLFGDTVNTAYRMESSSMALRIHMSSKTADILKKLPGGYILDCRGEREVKGKGIMTTYWLKGKETFTKPLPDMNLAASESKHEFK